MTEQAAFLTAIAADPGDDVCRLGYADWLDENDQHDRAEFIRLQISLVGHPAHHKAETGCPPRRRERELLDRHRAAWSRLRCPKCGGAGGRHFAGKDGDDPGFISPCLTCNGTGDLLSGRTVTFARGFPESVSCMLGEVGREEAHQFGDTVRHVWVLSEWARAVVLPVPVVRFVAQGLEPFASQQYPGRFRWYTHDENQIPKQVYDLLEGERIGLPDQSNQQPYWRTAEAAKDALSLALGGFVRAEVYEKAVPT